MLDKNLASGPIFIGGPDRCGKTTLQAFLVSHPHLSIPDVGSNMWTYFYGQFGDLGEGENFERCLEAMLRYKHVRFLQPDPERIRQEFWQAEPTYGRLFALFHQHYAERAGKRRWGVQTGLIERYADQVIAAYPAAKIIHMIRDPRDRYQASLALWPNGKGRAGGAVARWLYSVNLAQRNLQKYPDHYKIVQYETLVRQPEKTLQEICHFIGETYDPEMLTMNGAPERRDKLLRRATTHSGPTPLSAEFIGAYQGVVPEAEVAFIQGWVGRQMTAFNYPLAAINFSPAQRLRYSLYEWPLNLLRLGAWLGIEQLQHRLPVLFGRKPDSRTMITDGHKQSGRRKGIHTKTT